MPCSTSALTRPHSTVEGTGPLQNGNRNGALLHVVHAFTADGTPLGTLSAQTWSRDGGENRPKRQTWLKRFGPLPTAPTSNARLTRDSPSREFFRAICSVRRRPISAVPYAALSPSE